MNKQKTTERFERAVKLLYEAYHNKELVATDCSKCAVGNLVGHPFWQGSSITTTPIRVSDVGKNGVIFREVAQVDEFYYPVYCISFDEGEDIDPDSLNRSGYNEQELAIVERLFLEAHFGFRVDDLEAQFDGLCAVVEYLAELDDIPNPMFYTKLFEREEDEPKYELCLVE